MTTIDQLFCTPDQGRRLKELVPELDYTFMWPTFQLEGMSHPAYWSKPEIYDGSPIDDYYFAPALTLQELRDLAKSANHKHFEQYEKFLFDSFEFDELENLLDVGSAPELASWIIERLEEAR